MPAWPHRKLNMKGIPLTVKEQNEVDKAMDLSLEDQLEYIKNFPEITVRTTIPDPKNWRKK